MSYRGYWLLVSVAEKFGGWGRVGKFLRLRFGDRRYKPELKGWYRSGPERQTTAKTKPWLVKNAE